MNSPFRWLWTGAGLSNLGDGITLTALPLISLAAGAGPGEVALVTTVATIAWPVFGLHAGWLVDRLSPQRLLAAVNGLRALALVGLSATIAFDSSVTIAVFAAAFVYGLAETLVDTSLIAGIPRTVSRTKLTGANSRIEATINIANQLAGPPLAGLLLGATGLLAAASGGGLYALAAIAGIGLIRSMHRRAPGDCNANHDTDSGRTPGSSRSKSARDTSNQRGLQRVREGMRFLWRHRLQRELTLLTAAMSLVWGAWTATFVLYAVTPGPLNLSSAAYGWLLTAMAIGGIISSALTERLQARFSTSALLFIDAIGTLGLVLPAALGAPLPIIIVGLVTAGAGSTIWRILVAVIRQQTTPNHLIGRVYSASRVVSWGALPLGAALAALGVETMGLPGVFWISSGLSIGICGWLTAAMPRMQARIAYAEAETTTTSAGAGANLFNPTVDKESNQA
ncbi:MFS transporter [Brevibacterium zhoupengii]|uniref:MFS transporter n=1 Tax=Brevibacterium zhoupengii TaxID=2898795 RepID=UPI001E64C11B|nr:MFS transporter [Brevibacterium zhoupengii]